ncbi:flagellar hook-length control protein FliK [Pseudomonas veronii]|uniref:flagellar hook-length control protein FliK n=1 Tax=Pseudomonas veronii TaxID=76761 RepID=UPI001474CEC7|nr:flagellar hook-length control protein FliK [Pseudomonas veronii]NMX37406.1 flagellar hook-length control protein FliK [Pseudomonas veronii]
MPVAPNSLLQAASVAKPQAPAANPPAAAAEPRDKGPGFAQVFASQGSKPSTKADDNSAKPTRDKPADASAKPVAGNDKPVANNDKPAAGTPAVADSGKPLPADPPAKPADSASSDQTPPADPALAQQPAADPTVAPVVDPALIVTVTPVAVPVPVETPAPAAAKDDKAQPLVTTPPAVTDAAKPAFDPAADPLDALPAVRLAMEQGGHVSASSQTPQKAAPTSQDQPTVAQNFATGLANMVDQQASKDSTDQGGDKAFGGLIEEGLKDLKGASSDTRVDDFANRLAALTQAATPKTANALPPVTNAPLAMHQSGWTEEIVNRVMYLSSANLKSAEIQLQPAELGRLDIKVNMTADQQAQVTFMSGHAVVRDALESQSGRLREMFAQQGMGQVDVNVSDQSRGWQGQGQSQQQQNQANGVSGRGGRGDNGDVADHAEVAAAVAPVTSTVIGSSAVDYYA